MVSRAAWRSAVCVYPGPCDDVVLISLMTREGLGRGGERVGGAPADGARAACGWVSLLPRRAQNGGEKPGTPPLDIKQLFAQADVNKDNKIQISEICALVSVHPSLVGNDALYSHLVEEYFHSDRAKAMTGGCVPKERTGAEPLMHCLGLGPRLRWGDCCISMSDMARRERRRARDEPAGRRQQ